MQLLKSTRDTRHLGIDFRKLSVKNLQNWIFGNNDNYLAKKIPDFEFSHVHHYSHTLKDNEEKTLVSFSQN